MSSGPDPAVSSREILLFMVQSPDPAFTAKEIGDEFDKTRQWGHQQLQKVESSGYVSSKNPGGNSRFYWVTEGGKQYLSETRKG